jgi:protein-export membrane protein SecD
VATPTRSAPRPWRALAGLAIIIVVLLCSILGTGTFSPGKWHQQFKVALGLDLSSGTQVVLQAATSDGKPPAPGEMQQAIGVLDSRVNGTGNSGAQVRQLGSDMVSVSVPRASPEVINLISATARLRFRPVLLMSPPGTTARYGDAAKVSPATLRLFAELKCAPGPAAGPVSGTWKATVGYSAAAAQYDDLNRQIVSCDSSGTKYVLDTPTFQGTDLAAVNATLVDGKWVVDLGLHDGAAGAFGQLTENQYNSYFSGAQAGNQDDAVLDSSAVVLDGDVQSVVRTTVPIPTGQVEITGGAGGFTEQQATQLANVLKFGSLPLSFTRQSVSSISATTARDSLHAGLTAGVIGLTLVVAYQFFYYRGLGTVAASSLLIAALLSYLAVVLLSRYQGYTMGLAGIAGLIVAIGITADSFIVFFERLRDEVRDGMAPRPAVQRGWRRARRTILVSDTVSFLAAVLLYEFAVSDVRGFAYTLGLTTLIDVLVVFLFTKPVVTLLAGTKFFGSAMPRS